MCLIGSVNCEGSKERKSSWYYPVNYFIIHQIANLLKKTHKIIELWVSIMSLGMEVLDVIDFQKSLLAFLFSMLFG